MINKDTVTRLVRHQIQGTDLFIVDINVSHSNNIQILVDSDKGVSVQECMDLSRAVERDLDREEDDFQLEVSSPGLSEPLKVLPQYLKNIGREVEVLTKEGIKHQGRLKQVSDKGLAIEEKVKIKGEKKRPEIKVIEREFDFDHILSTKLVISFK